ncbi:hypothetical protein H2203_009026 [Taxawa tesnikishii (nom. ined.)]|nr:hypothetical protein H2203_009026 [Dothideales sp. JES 119]
MASTPRRSKATSSQSTPRRTPRKRSPLTHVPSGNTSSEILQSKPVPPEDIDLNTVSQWRDTGDPEGLMESTYPDPRTAHITPQTPYSVNNPFGLKDPHDQQRSAAQPSAAQISTAASFFQRALYWQHPYSQMAYGQQHGQRQYPPQPYGPYGNPYAPYVTRSQGPFRQLPAVPSTGSAQLPTVGNQRDKDAPNVDREEKTVETLKDGEIRVNDLNDGGTEIAAALDQTESAGIDD